MHSFPHPSTREEAGFSLIELLVVILIIGILAAIAIPTFVTQKGKASDAGAKSYVRHLQTAQEAYYTDNDAYASSLAALQSIEQALNQVPSRTTAPTASSSPRGGFTVTATSTTNVTYTITRASDGRVSRSCDRPSVGGCSAGSSW
jgi:type IV pilus assembly protein PilA